MSKSKIKSEGIPTDPAFNETKQRLRRAKYAVQQIFPRLTDDLKTQLTGTVYLGMILLDSSLFRHPYQPPDDPEQPAA